MQDFSAASAQYYEDLCSCCKGEMTALRNDKSNISGFLEQLNNVWHTTYAPECAAGRFASMED